MEILEENIFKFLLRHLKDVKINTIIYVIQVIISASSIPLGGYVTKCFIDYLSDHEITFELMVISSILFLLWWEMWNIFYRTYEYSLMKITPHLKTRVIYSLMDYASKHSHKYYQENFAGSLSNKISDVSKNIATLFITLLRLMHRSLIVIFSIIIISSAGFQFSVIIGIYFTIFIIINLYFIKPVVKLTRKFAESRAKSYGKLVDLISNISNVKYFATRKFEMNLLNKYLGDVKNNDTEYQKYLIKINYLKNLLGNIMCALIVFYAVKLYGDKKLSYGDFYLIFNVCLTVTSEMWNFLVDISDAIEETGTCKQALHTIYTPHENKDLEDAGNIEIAKGNIEFINASFKYSEDKWLFQNLSLKIKGGTKVGLVGYSGSGKSSFVNLLIRFFDIDDGKILIDKQDIMEVTQNSLRKNIGFIPQEAVLFHRNILENIRYGRLDATDEEVIEAAKRAHIHDFILKMENGYNTIVGERGAKLSGGQRQRIAIARAILKDAPILVLDEATSSLDTITEQLIQDSLTNLMENRTTICIAHRLSTLLNMDRIIVFDKGNVIEDGTHLELVEKDGQYAKMWNAQISEFSSETLANNNSNENLDNKEN